MCCSQPWSCTRLALVPLGFDRCGIEAVFSQSSIDAGAEAVGWQGRRNAEHAGERSTSGPLVYGCDLFEGVDAGTEGFACRIPAPSSISTRLVRASAAPSLRPCRRIRGTDRSKTRRLPQGPLTCDSTACENGSRSPRVPATVPALLASCAPGLEVPHSFVCHHRVNLTVLKTNGQSTQMLY